MKFVLIYKNDEGLLAHIKNLLLGEVKKGARLDTQEINAPFFATRLSWPNTKEILGLPLNVQCEEFEVKGNEFISIRKSVIDIEVIPEKAPEPAPAKEPLTKTEPEVKV